MVVRRDDDEWYVGGTMPAFSGPPPFGWVERFDPDTLDTLVASPELPCGEHVWCGAILVHANGSVYSVNGNYLHRLDPADLTILGERELPVSRSHNGLLVLADGTLVTKDLRLEGQGGTTITRLDPETLELVCEPLVLAEGSMGRIAADLNASGETVYVPGTEHLFALRVTPDGFDVDTWSPRYRTSHTAGGAHGLAWDSCISEGSAWVMDCGDITSVRMIHTTEPNGRWDTPPGSALSWRQPAPWDGPQRLLRSNLETGEIDSIAPFGNAGGGIIAPPVHIPEHAMAIAWDSINGGLAGVDTSGDTLDVAWTIPEVRPSMQPVVFPESGELVINDFTDHGSDDLVVVDIAGGEIIDRVPTGSRIANGMFLSPGPNRSVFYCSTLTLSRVSWT